MHKAKHSKFRNTGLLFELLTRQTTADILAGKDESVAKNLLFKYFSPNSELGKELILYNFLMNETAKNELWAEKYVMTALKQREKINSKKLFTQKYNLIKEINSAYSAETLLRSTIKNYKTLASIYKIFESHVSEDSKFELHEIIQARNCVCENLCGDKKKSELIKDETVKLYREQSEDIRLLSYKLLISSINDKYKNLDERQKALLRAFINDVTNTGSLAKLIDEEVKTIKSDLTELMKSIDSNVIRIKITETIKQLEKVTPTKSVKDNQIMVLLLSYELINEIKSVISDTKSK